MIRHTLALIGFLLALTFSATAFAAWSADGLPATRAPLAVRVAEGSGRACVASCIAQCRAEEQSCGGGSSCGAQYQICARRCVVSCGR